MPELPPLDPEHLFGRAALVERIEATWAAGARWISLVGPPGAGKTRIGRVVGDCFIDLVPARTGADVVRIVANTLGIGLGSIDEAAAIDRIGRGLAKRTDRIVLDNLEQLVDVLPPLVQAWMGTAPMVRWVGTTRRPMGLLGEVIVPVGGLDAPAAIALFRARAWAAGVDCAAHALAPIVTLLDGLPLAIELAAARTPALPLPTLRAALESGAAVLPTLDATLAAAWQLLTAAEQTDLRALCTFNSEFELEAAAAVLDRPAIAIVDQLRAYGWLRLNAAGRYRHYVRVRAFVCAQCDHPAAAVRHAHWFGAAADRLWRATLGPDPVGALDGLALLADDLHVVLTHGPPDAVGGAALGLHTLSTHRGPWHRGTPVIDTALARGVSGRHAVELLSLRALTWAMRGRYIEAAEALVDALARAESLAAPDLIAWVLGGLSPVRRFEGRLTDAEALAHREKDLADAHALERETARALFNLAGVRAAQQAHAEAAELWRQARARAIRVGHVRAAAVSLANLTIMAQQTGALSEAQALCDRALAELTAVEMPVMLAKMTAKQIELALALGDLSGAARHIERGTAVAARLFDDELAVDMAIATAQLADRMRAPDARARWQAAESMARTLTQPALLERVRQARPTPVDPAGRWLVVPTGERVDLQGRPVLQRVLMALANSVEPLSVTAVFAAAWPDESIQPDAAANRVYTAIRALRRAGAPIETRPGAGYVLADYSAGFSHRSDVP